MKLCRLLLLSFLASHLGLHAVEPLGEVRRIPPPGVAVPDDVRAELTAGAAALAQDLAKLRGELAGKPKLQDLLTDVEIFHKAVDWSLRYDEFSDKKQFDVARKQLALAAERIAALRAGKAPWAEQTGLVVRAYRSKIDDSLQPYGLVVPESYKAGDKTPLRLDFWLHGRGEKLSELSFLDERMRSRGEFAPEKALVVHLYERYCNANKFAGEMDLFEALEAVKKAYPIDENRLVVRGFSMGGGSCWQYGTHFAGEFAAVAPGAGFGETEEFFKVYAEGKTPPPWWEQVLYRWYNSTLCAGNLFNTTTVAYSGEIDGQKQAADIMARYMKGEGLELTHLIGPGMGHKYHPEVKPKIEELVTAAAEKGRRAHSPSELKFTTYTLVYPEMKWGGSRAVRIEGLGQSWERADVRVQQEGFGLLKAETKNVTALQLYWGATDAPGNILLDSQRLPVAWDGFHARFHREPNGQWVAGGFTDKMLRKKPGLCGPIDHAFMSRFLMVRPTGQPMNATVGAWAKGEMDHALGFWRQVYRGDAPVKDDNAVTEEDIRNSNLILWGDPKSNAVLAKIIKLLPFSWTEKEILLGSGTYDATEHAPILIFPNPLNREKYVVLNSGVTYREKALLNNSDQTPKLPDWAVVNLKTPPGPQWPGLVIDAGFFNEQWQIGHKAKPYATSQP